MLGCYGCGSAQGKGKVMWGRVQGVCVGGVEIEGGKYECTSFEQVQHSTSMQDGQQVHAVSEQSTTISARRDGMSVKVP